MCRPPARVDTERLACLLRGLAANYLMGRSGPSTVFDAAPAKVAAAQRRGEEIRRAVPFAGWIGGGCRFGVHVAGHGRRLGRLAPLGRHSNDSVARRPLRRRSSACRLEAAHGPQMGAARSSIGGLAALPLGAGRWAHRWHRVDASRGMLPITPFVFGRGFPPSNRAQTSHNHKHLREAW